MKSSRWVLAVALLAGCCPTTDKPAPQNRKSIGVYSEVTGTIVRKYENTQYNVRYIDYRTPQGVQCYEVPARVSRDAYAGMVQGESGVVVIEVKKEGVYIWGFQESR